MNREFVGELNSTTTVSGNGCSSPEVDVQLSPEVENGIQPDPPPPTIAYEDSATLAWDNLISRSSSFLFRLLLLHYFMYFVFK